MRYVVDHDLHIHSKLSSCSKSPEQTPERIAQYAEDNGLKTICITDHFWDENVPGATPWYAVQNYPHICLSKPLPQPQGAQFLFGCETDLDKHMNLGISRERMNELDFIIIPTTHFHMHSNLSEEEWESVDGRAAAWLRRLDGVLCMDLPFRKIGFAHLTTDVLGRDQEEWLKVIAALPENALIDVFQKVAKYGAGIELNAYDIANFSIDEEIVLRPYRIAKACGCKFYFGSDAHQPERFLDSIALFESAVTLLDLTEDDKFILRQATL